MEHSGRLHEYLAGLAELLAYPLHLGVPLGSIAMCSCSGGACIVTGNVGSGFRATSLQFKLDAACRSGHLAICRVHGDIHGCRFTLHAGL